MINQSEYELMNILIKNAENFIQQNTNVAMRGVTAHMISNARLLLDKMRSEAEQGNLMGFNRALLGFYRIIPRITDGNFLEYSNTLALERLTKEQMFLDAVESARDRVLNKTDVQIGNTPEEEVMVKNGLEVCKASEEDVRLIKRMMGGDSHRFVKAWKVLNKRKESDFRSYLKRNEISSTTLLWHGSPTPNFLSIFCNGLDLEHACYGMFGKGIYFAPKFGKSRGYTSVHNSYWRSGDQDYAMLGIFEVATGKKHDVYNCSGVSGTPHGFDCVWAHAGSTLLNDEVILYKNDCSSIRYLVQTT